MTKSLDNKLLEDKTQEADLYINNHGCKSILRYIKVLFRSQKVNVSDVLEVGFITRA